MHWEHDDSPAAHLPHDALGNVAVQTLQPQPDAREEQGCDGRVLCDERVNEPLRLIARRLGVTWMRGLSHMPQLAYRDRAVSSSKLAVTVTTRNINDPSPLSGEIDEKMRERPNGQPAGRRGSYNVGTLDGPLIAKLLGIVYVNTTR